MDPKWGKEEGVVYTQMNDEFSVELMSFQGLAKFSQGLLLNVYSEF